MAIGILRLHFNLMGPLLYMWLVFDRKAVMPGMIVCPLGFCIIQIFPKKVTLFQFRTVYNALFDSPF